MPFVIIPVHDWSRDCEYLKTDDGCYYCCDNCNYATHTCHGCGNTLTHLDNNPKTKKPHTGCTDDPV